MSKMSQYYLGVVQDALPMTHAEFVEKYVNDSFALIIYNSEKDQEAETLISRRECYVDS